MGLREGEWQPIDVPTRLVALITNNRVWRSIFRFAYPSSDKTRALIIPAVFFLHIHPLKVSARSIRLTYTWGLGLFLFFLFGIETVTGILLAFVYVPDVSRAYSDVQTMSTTVAFGALLRNIHRWGAHLMVLAVFLHMMRVFYTGAYKRPREFNWVIGVMLLLLTLALSFTGYLLPWDQLSFWAITVSTNLAGYAPFIGESLRVLILGAKEVGQEALIRFYVLHVMLLPLLMSVLIGFHFWRIRKDGGLAASNPLPRGSQVARQEGAETPAAKEDDPPESAEGALPMPGAEARQPEAPAGARVAVARKQTLSTWPNLLVLEIIAGLFITVVLVLMSMAVDAPLRDLANADVTENPAKAPWYFVNLQELLLHMDAALAGVWIPALLVLGLMALPFVDRDLRHAGEWFGHPEGSHYHHLVGCVHGGLYHRPHHLRRAGGRAFHYWGPGHLAQLGDTGGGHGGPIGHPVSQHPPSATQPARDPDCLLHGVHRRLRAVDAGGQLLPGNWYAPGGALEPAAGWA